MDIQQIGVLSLIKAAITDEASPLPENFNFETALEAVKSHQISSMLYYGAVNCGLDVTTPAMKQLFSVVCKCVAVSEKQKFEVGNLCKAFSDNNIDHMPLKGTILRDMYPHSDMRLMSDADILIKTEQYDRIHDVMLELGFTEGTESNHEYVWKKSGIVIELHKRLIPSYNKDYYAYYGDGWRLAVPSEIMPHRFEMSHEDQMIYLFTHFAKHYRDGGIGLRHITDLYVYRRYIGALDEEYIKKELETLGTYEFYTNITDTINVWFNGGKATEKTDFITDFIFSSGVYGKLSQKRIAQTLKANTGGEATMKNAKNRHMLRMIFPSLENMKLHYGFLKKLPFLLPAAWVMRLFRIVFFKGKKAKSYYNDMKNISTEDISDYQQVLNYVGLDFKFEE